MLATIRSALTVESGEGIESYHKLQHNRQPQPQWNPVKELKVSPKYLNDAINAYGWNPVKELKDLRLQSLLDLIEFCKRAVESGEGIERSLLLGIMIIAIAISGIR